MHYYNNSDDLWIIGYVVGDILERNSVDDLHRLSYLLTSEDPADGFARQNLINKFGQIGTKECLSILRQAADFWREQDRLGWVRTIEDSIKSIEQRFGIGSAEDKDS
ncbi:MAG: hypothetical protein WBM02_09655, partial [bacterium]